jgi:hypothetical protein
VIRSVQVPLATVAGILVGVGAVVFVQTRLVRAAATLPTPSAEPGPVALLPHDVSSFPDPATDRRLASLEMQVRELSRAKEPDDASATQSAPTDDRLATAERARLDFEARLAEHQASPRDSRWAAPKERAIAQSIRNQTGANTSFSLVDVDCRSTSCVARLKWPSEQEARADIRGFMQNADIDCARQVTLPASSGPGDYTASVLFDCPPSND